jgi:TatD DNase family protein
MIDVHCHLEQEDYSSDRDEVIEKCRQQLKAIITCCAHPRDFDLTIQLTEKYKGFIFATAGIHPQYVREVDEKQKEEFFELIKKNRDKIVAVGEVGLDFNWEKENEWREKQKQMFVEFIGLAKELKLPLVIHSWDACEDAVRILEQENAKQVLMHMFEDNRLAKEVANNNWYVSMNAIVLSSKKFKKVVRDMPLEQLMLETDAPWLAPEGFGSKRNDPTAVKFVAEKIAEIKKTSFDEADEITTENALRFFDLTHLLH